MRSSRSSRSAARSGLITLALLLTRMSPSPLALSSATTSATGAFTTRVRSHGASVSVVDSTTFSAPASHRAYPRSRGSALSSSATDGQYDMNPSALRRPSSAVLAPS
jgi:hypothetical protein